ncbi:MAG TPA: glycosyltransferase [Thermoanaerobaculia bacterium]|nr:glycosyltransferase [Thermoanaerobaculia bacterium]
MPSLKHRLRDLGIVRPAWAVFRRNQLLARYEKRREHYARIAEERKLVYRERDAVTALRERLAKRGYAPKKKSIGDIHTFAWIPMINWHEALLPDLRELGPVSLFDYVQHGFRWQDFLELPKNGPQKRQQMNALLLDSVREAHARQPIDWMFVYANGSEAENATLDRIANDFGFPIVMMCLDDKQSWDLDVVGGQNLGQVDIAPHFDLCWTSARVACEWYMAENAIPIYLPEGFEQTTFRRSGRAKDIGVSFIGGAYGFRPNVIEYLRRNRIDVEVFGSAWGRPLDLNGQVDLFNRSRINLGMGGIDYSEELTNVKGRDFEVPGTGGGMYLTSFNPDLAQHFDVGREIACYRNRSEMVELIRYYLARIEEAEAVAEAAYRRCVAEHRWRHRYERICRAIGIIKETNE